MPDAAKANLAQILRLEVPIVVHVAERNMRVSEVLGLLPGAIIELPKAADGELDLLVNNKIIGQGHAVKVGENFGIRLTYLGDLRHRIAAMGGQTSDPAPAQAPAQPPVPAPAAA